MAASPPCCFRLEATRGPHSGSVHRYCSKDRAASPSSSSPVRALSIGRKKRCWLRLPKDLEVSSVHAEFRFVEGEMGVALRDAKSTNGTKLNGSSLKPLQDHPLSDGDLVAVGRTSLRFVKVVHGPQCREDGDVDTANARASASSAIAPTSDSVLTSSASSSVAQPAPAPVVIVLDDESAKEREESAASAASAAASAAGSGDADTRADQPDTEPAYDDLVPKPLKSVVVSVAKEENKKDEVESSLKKKSRGDKEVKCRTGGVDESTPEEATCTVCKATIGLLDLLEQQAHLNECLGGRVAARVAGAADEVKPKSRKRANAADGATRAKKPRKPKARAGTGDDTAAVPKPRKPRKRKRADAGETIELSLALNGNSKMSKEQQTDMQLKAAKKKLEDLDAQMAKLAKRRVNLVKTLDRLERAKEKLRKSQVLPPGKVSKFLDLEAALDAIFPGDREAHPVRRYTSDKEAGGGSVVAKRYAPSKWTEAEDAMDVDEEKQAELAAVAAISMWARASQQLFGLHRDTLLYRNSVLRTFLGDDDDVNDNSFDLGNADSADNDDEDAELEREIDSEARVEAAPAAEGVDANGTSRWDPTVDDDVPLVVKRVFPNWQRDMAFVQDQTAEELEVALEAMNEAVAQLEDVMADDVEPSRGEDTETKANVPNESSVSSSKDQPPTGTEQRRACEYMAQVMTQLIAEKRKCAVLSNAQPDDELQTQQDAIDLLDSSSESVKCDTVGVTGIETSKNKSSSPQELPKVDCSCPVDSTKASPIVPSTTAAEAGTISLTSTGAPAGSSPRCLP